MNFTYVDGAIAFIVVVSAIMAYARGFTRELFAIGGWIIAAAAAAFLTPMVEPLIREIPVVGDFLGSSCVLSVIAAFTLIMAIGLLILAVFTPLFSSFVLESALAPLDRVLGFAFGVARGALLIAVAYLLYGALVGDPGEWAALANAASYDAVVEVSNALDQALPEEMPPWLQQRIDAIMAPCAGETVSPEAVQPETFPAEPSQDGDQNTGGTQG